MAWMRYPGRLAHNTGDAGPINEGGRRVGTIWRTTCGRYVRLWFDGRPWEASWVDAIELRLETPRGWCLRCVFHAAVDALILPDRSFESFVARAQTGHYELVECTAP